MPPPTTPPAARRPVICYDGRGYGFSDRDVTGFSLDARLADHLETAPAQG
jgi:hypothetical protein